jgi:hypothetical protein
MTGKWPEYKHSACERNGLLRYASGCWCVLNLVRSMAVIYSTGRRSLSVQLAGTDAMAYQARVLLAMIDEFGLR